MKMKDLRVVMFFSELVVRLIEAISNAVRKEKKEPKKDDNGNRDTSDYKTF
jgi:hypothetical protein